ncbi:hypothetical protein BpHYR1_027512 [Brachionus plicatilis]|uniref:Uncharacterized protein n=1 Tax=Brachionus plicatilis TaxID=10195 RepID=A0A3M7RYH7_BRAPC|nr:hypothetical protein BpHYR1_027512 [Brachionus plicatilis]
MLSNKKDIQNFINQKIVQVIMTNLNLILYCFDNLWILHDATIFQLNISSLNLGDHFGKFFNNFKLESIILKLMVLIKN